MVSGFKSRREVFRGEGIVLLMLLASALFLAAVPVADAQLVPTYAANIPTEGDGPQRIALDSKTGMIYVTLGMIGQVQKYNPDGTFAGTIPGLEVPVAIAVDGNGTTYVGEQGSKKSVSIFSKDGQYLGMLGKGLGEFGSASDIAIGIDGLIYVTDATANVIKRYDPVTRQLVSSFGSGQVSSPSGIAADATNIYVVDQANKHIDVFTYAGAWVKTISLPASISTTPWGLYGLGIDVNYLYLVDKRMDCLYLFDKAGNYIQTIGTWGSGAGAFTKPTDAAVFGSRLYVSDSENYRIDIFDLFDTAGIAIQPSTLSVSLSKSGSPVIQQVQLMPQIAGNTTAWSASATSAAVSIDTATGSLPAAVNVTVDASTLAPGSYYEAVWFHSAGNGVDYPLLVIINVTQPEVSVAPADLAFSYKIGSPSYGSAQQVSITTSDGSYGWTASSDKQWLTVTAAGNTPGMLSAELNQGVTSLAAGVYNASITVNAGTAGSKTVSVVLTVGLEGTIVATANLDGAAFTISGPSGASLAGTGKSATFDHVSPGTYTISYAAVPGYKTPAARVFDVVSGQTASVNGQYFNGTGNAIFAAKGPGARNDSTVRVLDLNGNEIYTIPNALNTKYGARVAAGDIDGDGFDEVIVVPGAYSGNKAFLKVFGAGASVVASVPSMGQTIGGAAVAAADLNGDGQAEVAMSYVNFDRTQGIVIYSFESGNLVEKQRIALTGTASSPAELAFGDLDGDGKSQLLVSTETDFFVYGFDIKTLTPTLLKSVPGSFLGDQVSLASADLNSDGKAEILIGFAGAQNASILSFNSDYTQGTLAIDAFAFGSSRRTKAAPSVAAMDTDGDGAPEILVGKGKGANNDATLRIYNSQGALLREITAFQGSKYGVQATFGVIQR